MRKRERYPIAVSAVTEQIETDWLTVHLPPEIFQRHQQGRGEQIRLGLDVALVVVTRLDVVVAAFEQVLLMAVQDVAQPLPRLR